MLNDVTGDLTFGHYERFTGKAVGYPTSPGHQAALAIAKINDPSTTEHLVKKLDDDAPMVRANAAIALGKMGDKRAVATLIRAFEEGNDDIEYQTAEILGELKDPRAVAPLVEAVKNSSFVPDTVFEALGTSGDRQAVTAIVTYIEKKCARLRSCRPAVKALGAIGDPRAGEAIRKIHAATEEKDSQLDFAVIQALGDMKDKGSTKFLLVRLENPEFGSKEAILTALGKIKDPQSIFPLITLLKREEGSFIEREIMQTLSAITGLHMNKTYKWEKWWERNKEKYMGDSQRKN